jgi:hypothetical protein
MTFFRLMMTGAALDCVPIFTTLFTHPEQGIAEEAFSWG